MGNTDYQRLDSRKAYEGRLLKVFEEDFRLPDGEKAVFDVIHHNGAAAILPVDESGRIILVRQFRPAIEEYTWEIPAGGRDSVDEPFLETAMRELREETGRTAEKWEHLISINPVAAYSSELIEIYVATELSKPGSQDLDDDEFIDVGFFDEKEITEMIRDLRIKDAKTIAAVMTWLCLKDQH